MSPRAKRCAALLAHNLAWLAIAVECMTALILGMNVAIAEFGRMPALIGLYAVMGVAFVATLTVWECRLHD